jgi:hypothetical protein
MLSTRSSSSLRMGLYLLLLLLYTWSRQYNILCTCERLRVVIILDSELVITRLQVTCDLPPQFAEFRKSGCPHPHNEMFILRVHPLAFGRIRCSIKNNYFIRYFELLTLIIWPTYTSLVNHNARYCESVVKERFSNKPARWSNSVRVQFVTSSSWLAPLNVNVEVLSLFYT